MILADLKIAQHGTQQVVWGVQVWAGSEGLWLGRSGWPKWVAIAHIWSWPIPGPVRGLPSTYAQGLSSNLQRGPWILPKSGSALRTSQVAPSRPNERPPAQTKGLGACWSRLDGVESTQRLCVQPWAHVWAWHPTPGDPTWLWFPYQCSPTGGKQAIPVARTRISVSRPFGGVQSGELHPMQVPWKVRLGPGGSCGPSWLCSVHHSSAPCVGTTTPYHALGRPR